MVKNGLLISVIFFSLVLSACSGSATPVTPAAPATATVDPCLPQYARTIAQKMHSHMREFGDASTLASALTTDKLPSAIAEMQRIRRAAQDEPAPSTCLGKLKELEVTHMNVVINIFLAMLNGEKSENLQTGIENARKLNDAYTQELASVLGVTLVPQPTITPTP
jgi:hypothetical protein